jgi:hypothetical protein
MDVVAYFEVTAWLPFAAADSPRILGLLIVEGGSDRLSRNVGD